MKKIIKTLVLLTTGVMLLSSCDFGFNQSVKSESTETPKNNAVQTIDELMENASVNNLSESIDSKINGHNVDAIIYLGSIYNTYLGTTGNQVMKSSETQTNLSLTSSKASIGNITPMIDSFYKDSLNSLTEWSEIDGNSINFDSKNLNNLDCNKFNKLTQNKSYKDEFVVDTKDANVGDIFAVTYRGNIHGFQRIKYNSLTQEVLETYSTLVVNERDDSYKVAKITDANYIVSSAYRISYINNPTNIELSAPIVRGEYTKQPITSEQTQGFQYTKTKLGFSWSAWGDVKDVEISGCDYDVLRMFGYNKFSFTYSYEVGLGGKSDFQIRLYNYTKQLELAKTSEIATPANKSSLISTFEAPSINLSSINSGDKVVLQIRTKKKSTYLLESNLYFYAHSKYLMGIY